MDKYNSFNANFSNPYKYEYLLFTWGGFYNKEHQDKHKEIGGCHYFDNFIERNNYLQKLKDIEFELNAKHLAFTVNEGFHVREHTILHRVILYNNINYYTQNDMGANYHYDAAKYHLQNKWYPGFNDYPLGEDFDYSKVKIIQEWITGSFTINNND